MHRVGKDIIPNFSIPVWSNLQNNCTVTGVELQTGKQVRIDITDLDLWELSYWLAEFMGGPVVLWSHRAPLICSVRKGELELKVIAYVIDRDKVVIVVEFVYGWEVSIFIRKQKWVASNRSWVSPEQFAGKLVLENAPKDTSGQLTHLGRSSLS